MVGIDVDEYDPSQANLYLSEDAGQTWKRILSGAWYFDSSNTYNLIAAAQWNGFTNTILYTQDQGSTWSNCQFGSEMKNYTILDVQTDLAGPSPYLWVTTYWTNYVGNDTGFSIFFMDFNFTMRTCNDSDYEYFTPSSNLSSCILGEEITVERRKPNSICISDLTQQNLTYVQICNCSRADYVCSFCFVPDQNLPGSPCVLQEDGVCAGLWDPTPPPVVCPFGTNYTGEPAYRKITGTKCINDLVDLTLPRSVPCPPSPSPMPMNVTIPQGEQGGMIPSPSPTPMPVFMNVTIPQGEQGETNNKATIDKTGYIVLGVLLPIGIIIVVFVVFCIGRYISKNKVTFVPMRDTTEMESTAEL